jgi:hypothetical protein
MKYEIIIKPAVTPENRHEIEKALKNLGYNVTGGGQFINMSQSDISFNDEK